MHPHSFVTIRKGAASHVISNTFTAMACRAYLPVLLLLAACTGSQEADVSGVPAVPRTEQEVAIASGTPVTLADLSITGMTCEMMCGGAIKSALAKLPGVTGTEIRFTTDASENHAVVTYDPAVVKDGELVKAVQALHDGQYKVSAVQVTRQVLRTGGAEQAPAEAADEDGVNAALPVLQLPSLFGLLARLVQL
jgi:copper chaperone CopZ